MPLYFVQSAAGVLVENSVVPICILMPLRRPSVPSADLATFHARTL